MDKVFMVRGAIKNYEWGKFGRKSAVACLTKSAFEEFEIEEKPYAEMWIGTHTSGPALIPSKSGMKLNDWLLQNPCSLGADITSAFGKSNGLPFLFKVLSVNKALSIQAHPDKESAEKLHRQFPDRYPDDNHKPEMAIALTDFEALCGFRPLGEIKMFFNIIPALRNFIDSKILAEFLHPDGNDLKGLFTSGMMCSADVFQPSLEKIYEFFKSDKADEVSKSVTELFLRLYDQYPGDIGCFCVFFLNYLKLSPGETIYLAANEPHAYLYGDCIECMACSDNVVRAGLTPKFRDVQTLCNMLTYTCKTASENKFLPSEDPNDPYVKIYNPPVREFAVDQIEIPQQSELYALKVLPSASVLLVVEGNGSYTCENEDILTTGSILFVSSDCQIFLKATSKLLVFRAYCTI